MPAELDPVGDETPFHHRVRRRLDELEEEYARVKDDFLRRGFRTDREREAAVVRMQSLELLVAELKALLREGE